MPTTVGDLALYNLRSSTLAAACSELAGLDLDQDASAFQEAITRLSVRGAQLRKILPFGEAGRATRLLITLIGKPTGYSIQKVWLMGEEKSVFRVTWRSLPLKQAINIASILAGHGFIFTMSLKGVIEMLFPDDTPPSCFFTSEDPTVWRKKQAQKKISRQVTKVAKKLDRK